jgi:membrane protein implicated in regulation of membrane protease activity
MAQPADARRRWLGLFCLTMAGGMLIWGLIIFNTHLKGFVFLFYWAACFLFTILAIVIALFDMRAVRRRNRAEQEDLLRATLTEIQRAKQEGRDPVLSDAEDHTRPGGKNPDS